MKPLPEALKELLAERGMSQTDVWAAVGLSSTTTSRWTAGQRGRELNKKSLETLAKISAFLEVPLTYWLEYRLHIVQKLGMVCPDLVDDVYLTLIEAARQRGVWPVEGMDDESL